MNAAMLATVFLVGFFAGMVGAVTSYRAGIAWEVRNERKRAREMREIDAYEPEPMTPTKNRT